MEAVICAEKLTKSFGGNPVLRGVDLVVSPGEAVAVIGRSGSGKTTLLTVLGGLDLPDSGTVRFRGRVLRPRDLRRYRAKNLGYLFQGGGLIEEFTARENVEAAISISGSGADAMEYLEMVGLRHLADRRPGKLSGGEGQRVALARALAKKPEILLLDEPTEGLDPETAQEILSLTRRLCREREIPMVIVTHRPEFARQMDRVLRLQDGVLTEVTP